MNFLMLSCRYIFFISALLYATDASFVLLAQISGVKPLPTSASIVAINRLASSTLLVFLR